MPNWTERKLEFSFVGSSETDKPEDAANPLRSVDFWVRYPGAVWLIEVKDPDSTPPAQHPGEVAGFLAEIQNDQLLKKHLLPKLYGTFAHLVQTGREPRGQIRYAIVVGLTGLTANERHMLTNKIQRVVDRIGPKVRHSRYWPVAEVHNIASWNAAHPSMSVTRVP